jgi:signal transduction histidine kinase
VTGPVRLWRSSLRLRLAVAGIGLASVIFAISAAAMISLYRQSLAAAVQHTAAAAAASVATRASQGWLPDPIPMPDGPGVPRVQVLDSAGRVITGDPRSAGQPAMFRLPSGVRRRQAVLDRLRLLPGASADVYAVRVGTPAGPQTVVAALSLGPVTARVREVIQVMVGSCLAALAVVGIVAWLTAGRVLRPVERMRSQAVAITGGGDLSGRLPDAGADELSKLAGTLNGMLASLQQSVGRQRRFVADAAHELRTPLAGLTAALEVAQAHPGAADGRLVSELLGGHRRLSRMVNDLLVLAALDGQAPRGVTPVDLAGVVTDCSRRSVPAGLALRVTTLQRVTVLGNEPQLSRMIGNLVDNALRYAASAVEIALSARDGMARIAVADDGPGVPAADRERIWDRFVRLTDDRSRASGGSGLGLAIVAELAAAHGGSASVRDRPGGPGAEFVVLLPVSQPG